MPASPVLSRFHSLRARAVSAGTAALMLAAGLSVGPGVGPSPALSLASAATLTGSASIDATQQARNDTAVARWQHYQDRLARFGVQPPRARDLAHPEQGLPAGLSPVTQAGQVVPGVAWTAVDGHRVKVLSRPTMRVVSTALEDLGTPFALGRGGPRAYGCGGFTAALWRGVGYPAPGTPTRQYRTYLVVPRAQRQVGDLVLFGSPRTGFTHVGVFLGEGQMVAADGATGHVGVVSTLQTRYSATVRVTVPRPVVANQSERPAAGIACGQARVTPPVPASGFTAPLLAGTYTYSARWGQKGAMWSGGFHTGLDFDAPTGTPVFAAAAGTVRVRTDQTWAGPQFVQIDHHNDHVTWYAHMSYVAAQNGQEVQSGQFLGYVGGLGNTTGPHLHFETRDQSSLEPYRNGPSMDPMGFITGVTPWPAPVTAARGR